METKSLKRAVIILLILVPAGFMTKFYQGPAEQWVNNHLGGVFYVSFLTIVLYILLTFCKNLKVIYPVIAALIITTVLEFLQLWETPVLEAIRNTFIGRTIIGSSFNPEDFIYYVLGSALAYFLILWCKKDTKP
jgi:hypothetical protein